MDVSSIAESERLMNLINAQGGNINNLWSIYAVVLFGLTGYVLANDNIRQSRYFTHLIVLFGLFSLANLGVIYKAQQIVFTAATEIRKIIESGSMSDEHAGWATTLATVSASHPLFIAGFHLALDIFIIYVLVRYRKKSISK